MPTPSVEVRFEDLRIEAEIQVGNRGQPNIFNSYRKCAPTLAAAAACLHLPCLTSI